MGTEIGGGLMKYFLCNLTWGRGSVGDEAILAGLLTQYDRNDVIVGSYDPEETHEIFKVKTVSELDIVNVDVLVIGGGFILPSSLPGLNRLVDSYRKQGCRIELRAVQFPVCEEMLQFIGQVDYVSVRYKSLSDYLHVDYEQDFGFCCPAKRWDHDYRGWVGYNAVHHGGGGTRASVINVELPEGKVLGIASVRHKCDPREDDFIATRNMDCDDYYHTVNPMKMSYLLSTLKCMYSQRKHLSLLSHLSGTPTYYFGQSEGNIELVKEWGVPLYGETVSV